MKQQRKRHVYFFASGILFFLGCQNEELPLTENEQKAIRQVTTVSFSTFKTLTGQADFKTTFALPENSSDLVARRSSDNNNPSNFIVDTDQIIQTVVDGKTSYSFPITPLEGEKEDRRFYLVVYDKAGSWLDMVIESDVSTDHEGNPKETGYREIYASAARGTGCSTIFTWVIRCNRKGKCAEGVCDRCSQCLKADSHRICGGKDKEDYYDGGWAKPGQPGGGGGVNPNPDPNPDPDTEEEEVVVTFPILLDNPKKECNKVKKLAKDVLFRQKMNNLLQATEFRFEKVFTTYKNPTPASVPTSQFKFLEMNGTISNPQVEYGYFPEILGIMHSHYGGLLSVYSVDDLADIYQKMKNPETTDDFFSGLVTKSGTRYMMTISDRAKFIVFGDEHLSTVDKKRNFVKRFYIKKYNIQEINSASENEKSFLKMIAELKIGITLFSGNPDFTEWQKLDYVNKQVIPSKCN